MKIKIVVSSALLILVQLLLVFGPWFEIKDVIFSRLSTAGYCLFVIALMATQYIKVKQLTYRKTKRVFSILIILYCFLFTISNINNFIFGSKWSDTHVYQNLHGAEVISQFVEYSGSDYDYRERLLIYQFSNGNRISLSWYKRWMHGTWKVYDVAKDSTNFKNMDIR